MTATGREPAAISVLGTLADGVVGSGARDGRLTVETAGIEIDWWVGADDAWRIPSDGGVHTVRPGIAPAIDARVRVPSGEAVVRGYAVAGGHAPFVVAEIENASPAPVVIAWVLRGAPGYRIGRVAIDGSTLLIDQRARVELPRVPLRWAVAPRAVGVRDVVVGGDAAGGAFETVATRRGDLEVAVLFPVAHRTRTRIAVTTLAEGGRSTAVAVAQLPSLADVERGWIAALERGMRVELPDEVNQAAADAARATVLLAVTRGRPRDRVVSRAAGAWDLAVTPVARVRRVRAVRDAAADPWPSLRATVAESGGSPRRAAEWLGGLHRALLRFEGERVDVLPHFPVEWLGLPVAVHDAPTPHGPVSFALRWHGARPALLWEVPAGVAVRAPVLDPAWKAVGSSGEALLSEIDTARLLPLSTTTASDPASVEPPESFT
jgi:hypothetical protein